MFQDKAIKRTVPRHKPGLYLLALIVAFSLVGYAPICAPCSVNAAPTPAKYLVIIVIDGCRPDYLNLVPTPNIDSLKADGIIYTNSWVGQLNNDTPPGHTTISTGRFGKNNGIISFGWREKRLLPSFWDFQSAISNVVINLVTATGWTDFGLWFQDNLVGGIIGRDSPSSWKNVVSGVFTSLIRENGATSIGAEYKKVYPEARIAAISCDKWYATAGLAADSVDYTVFADSSGIPPITYNPLLRIKPAGIKAAPPPDYIMADAAFVRYVTDNCDTDTWATDVALSIIEKTNPEILLITLTATDDAGHESGGITAPEKMGEVISNADKQVGRIVNAYKQANIYDETVFVILSDHGMTPVVQTVSQSVLNRIYVESGNFGTYSPHVYLLNQLQACEIAEKITEMRIPGIHGAYYKIQQADTTYLYEPTSATKATITGDLDSAYRYLLSTWASEKSPDIELITAENWHIDFKTGRGKTFVGNHDSATWLQQHIPLLIAGPGVRKGVVSESPARLVDVAPTVLALLGIVPSKMDGIILADALQTPSSLQAQEQTNLNRELMPLIEALMALSNLDIGAPDQK